MFQWLFTLVRWIWIGFLNLITLGLLGFVITQTLGYFAIDGVDPNLAFLGIFAFRYTRVIIHSIAYFCYRPAPVQAKPRYTARDVTVVVPTVTPDSRDFIETIAGICRNEPHTITVVTVGPQREAEAARNLALLRHQYPQVNIRITQVQEANKRVQIAHAAADIETPITFLVDASVFWGPSFLTSALAAFEDATVYLVGTNKRVQVSTRDNLSRLVPFGFIFNFFGSTYLGRHNFEIRATNTVDGGLFAVSGRTMGIRSDFLRDAAVMKGFREEKVSSFLGRFVPKVFNKPLLPDDDNYLTRQVVKAGKKVKIQYTEDARVEIAAQFTYPRYFSQCFRWARSTFRSNCALLITERSVYGTQGWSVYAVYINGMVNFALFCDATLIYLLSRSDYSQSWPLLLLWIMVSKMIKLIPYFILNPRDLVFFPVYVLFAYMHSFIKLIALFTFYSAEWSGRDLAAVQGTTTLPPPLTPRCS
ncbi:hypothetical protein SLS62_010258 [Diatrype stigma]|uniref:Glycosyltransferase family 2 protein n=1 Tax=Diatrype stigma TaxID=117547 RepID=A0AAN9UA58_9PEZI